MLLESLAKELVSVTSELVGGRTINIMNTEGIIVASTETERIGTFHQGALEAVRTGRRVEIRRDQLDRYPGAKEGCNMPLRVGGAIIGVVGIYGDPTEIQYLAHLLEVYATKYYQLEAMASPRLAESEIRGRILSDLLHHSEASVQNAVSLMESRKIRLAMPVTVAVVSARSGEPVSLPQAPLLPVLLARHLHPQRDVWGVMEDRLVLVLGHRRQPLRESLCRPGTPEAALLETYRFSFGTPCQSLWDIEPSYAQAALLDRVCAQELNDMAELRTHCRYTLAHTCMQEEPFLEELYARLGRSVAAQERDALLRTADCYYAADRSVSRAAAALFIHKNTLQYRMRRLTEALGLADCTDFEREYLLRLLAEHHKQKQGLRAL